MESGWFTRFLAAICIFGICLLTNLSTCQASGMFELRLNRFINDEGRDRGGNCCSSKNEIREKPEHCQQPCKTAFRICLTHFQRAVDSSYKCTFGDIRTPVIGENSFDPQQTQYFQQHPIQFNFTLRWPGTFTLIVDILHVRNEGESTLLSTRGDNIIISRLIKSAAALPTLSNDRTWIAPQPYRHRDSELQYSYRVRCQPHQYGNGCSIYCQPRDDMFGHYTCNENGEKVCLPGWTGNKDRKYCTEPICMKGCHPEHGMCDRPNECKCRLGWNGTLCDQCEVLPNCKNGRCETGYQCICNPGWGGLYCNQDLNYCTNHRPCQNGALCSNTGEGSYTCACKPGYTGKDCQTEINECLSSPCTNGTQCVDLINKYQCICPNGYYGPNCDEALTCVYKPCKNDGTCLNIDGTYNCQCVDGWTGDQCENIDNDCSHNRCQNGGSCESSSSGFVCQCLNGFKGRYCQEIVNDCSISPCYNGGSCYDVAPNDYKCRCIPGFAGKQCEKNINDCLSIPCANGGVCTDLVNDYQCTCPSGFTGKDCRHNTNGCSISDPCLNGGSCNILGNEFICRCRNGFQGNRCQIVKSLMTQGSHKPLHIQDDTENQPSTRIIMVSNDQNDLNTTQWIAICLGAGILVLLLIFAATCLVYQRKKNLLPTVQTNSNNQHRFNGDVTSNHVLPQAQICVSAEKTNRSDNSFHEVCRLDMYDSQSDVVASPVSQTESKIPKRYSKCSMARSTSASEDERQIHDIGGYVVPRTTSFHASIGKTERTSSRSTHLQTPDKANNRLPTYEEACKENDALLHQIESNHTERLASPLASKNSRRSRYVSMSDEELSIVRSCDVSQMLIHSVKQQTRNVR
uniref:Delta-like protein n=1 Tax=Phallusia mammillata TaxID=59560 RepID=A0A6F9DAC8_9ASCI|nr:delta protein [Phallusia mammillata]